MTACSGRHLAHLFCQDFFGGTSALAVEAEPEEPVMQHNLKPKQPHHSPKATSVIHLFMNGGPSQMDLFDPKPKLNGLNGQPFPGNVEEIGNSNTSDIGVVMGGQFKFARHGESGMWMADVLPHTAKMADDICLINSLWTDHPNHDNALYKIHSGRLFMGYPTFGAWTVYGLGSENQNLPAYVVLNDPLGPPKNGTRNWTSGFLPPIYQGTRFRPTGSPILNLTPQYEQPSQVTESARGLLNQLDEIHRQDRPHYPELDARMESYSLAARMQMSAGEALDSSRETAKTLAMYGIGEKWTDSYGRRCLLPGDWSSGASGSCRFFSKSSPGTVTPTSPPITRAPAGGRTNPWPRSFAISSSGASWIPRSSSGAASSVAHRPRSDPPTAFPAAITTCRLSPVGYPAAA